jgi:pantetheine-phosphate adenylyltransferase
MRATIYPGSFDPLTNGHLDIIERSSRTFDRVVLAISNNSEKSHTFSVVERIDLARQCVQHLPNVEVDTFSGLLMDYAEQKKIYTIVRGLRANSDFEYEFQLATINRKLNKNVETLLMMTSETSFYISSRLIREIAQFRGDVSGMVPNLVNLALQKKIEKLKR